MSNFLDFNMAPFLTDKLSQQDITTPTEIQQQSIPLVLSGKDILGSAETGSGKTLAFAAPIIHKLYENPREKAVIIAPTRELAEQIAQNIKRLLPQKMSLALLIGGAPMFKQLQQLKRLPQIIIGTPGRMIDHLERGKLDVRDTSVLVLDETDRMLDMGFSEQINRLVEDTPENRQTLLFSATMPRSIIKVANNYLSEPVRIKVGDTTKPSDNITQKFINVENKAKANTLFKECEEREGSIIVFVRTKMGADNLCHQLQKKGLTADTIHGDLRHGKRQKVIRAFHQKRFSILVATDVAARGLDIPHVEHVINYDLPQQPEDYVHRVGRTGRGGRTGESLCIVSPSDQHKLRAVKRFIGGDDNTEDSYKRRKPSKFKKGKFEHRGQSSSTKRWGSSDERSRDSKKRWGNSSEDSSRDSNKRWGNSSDDRSRDSKKRWGNNSSEDSSRDSNKRWGNSSDDRSRDSKKRWGNSSDDRSRDSNKRWGRSEESQGGRKSGKPSMNKKGFGPSKPRKVIKKKEPAFAE
ncbi:DEAD/DEAH box helicase [Candidatus Synchoanobacter obligatus]|uniref:DEAD/DEAH box helicase n=1 Tax=Candidatus Synchoanobacter obligatus TaxID=2919597 RepID=A0ABT1L3S7_9GAMM|nr:DEAD/DEAH box helicase [Candidatus Synchoanobacter obligatus]MCP8351850.1 DEAD/DEAH box helicase [Candidatus Synchoanobacter obligatus]